MRSHRMLTCALLLMFLTVNTANASTEVKQKNTQFQEIKLNKDFEMPETNVLLVSENEGNQATIDQSGLNNEVTLENKEKTNAKETKKHIFKIFNLKGGVQKSNKGDEPKIAEAKTEHTMVEDWLQGNYATGKWFGARPVLENNGLTINSSLLYSPFMKTRGGDNDGKTAKGYSLFNLSATLDTEKAHMWKGGTFYTLYQKKIGVGLAGPAGGAMGDFMDFDGWDARQMNQISECWYQQKLKDGKIRLKIGKQDANTDFGFLNSGWDFVNLAFSVNPTIPMPTYPDQSAFGFVAEINPKEWLSIRNGIYSRFNTPFNITEIEVKTKFKNMPGRYNIGAWEASDSTGYDMAQGYDYNTATTYYNTYNRNVGGYAQFEQMVYKEKKNDENDMQGLVVFGQFGISPSDRNDMSRYVGGGLHYQGLIPKRDNDKAGIAVASGNFASRLADINSRVGSETVLEAFYRIQLTPWAYLQPDVQFIMSPGGCCGNSVAAGLRTVITF